MCPHKTAANATHVPGHGTLVVRDGAGKRATAQKAAARVFVNPARLSAHHPTLRAFFAPYGIERRGSLFYARASAVRADHDALRVVIGRMLGGRCGKGIRAA